jgi:hypothetical protein
MPSPKLFVTCRIHSYLRRLESDTLNSQTTNTPTTATASLLGSNVLAVVSDLVELGILTSGLCKSKAPATSMDNVLQVRLQLMN